MVLDACASCSAENFERSFTCIYACVCIYMCVCLRIYAFARARVCAVCIRACVSYMRMCHVCVCVLCVCMFMCTRMIVIFIFTCKRRSMGVQGVTVQMRVYMYSACMSLVDVILQRLRICLTMFMDAYVRISEYVFGCVCKIVCPMHILHVLQQILNVHLRIYACICICICVYIYIYIYTHVCVYVCVYIYIYIYIYICIHICVYIYINTYICTHIYLSLSIYIYVYIYLYIPVYMY